MKFPIRQEIEILPADPVKTARDSIIIDSDGNIGVDRRRLNLGWTVTETIGIAIVNPRGVAAGKKSVVIK